MKLFEHERRVALLTLVLGAWTALVPNVAWASDAPDRERISQARAEADAVLANKQAECRQRFAVNDCLLEARKEHRAVVDPLRKELLLLDDKQRKQRAADRTERIRAKSEAQNEAGAAAAQAAASGTAPIGAGDAFPRATVRPKIRSMMPSASSSEAAQSMEPVAPVAAPASVEPDNPANLKAAKTQVPAEGYQTLRVRQAEARRQSVLRKNAERDAKKPPAKPLPVPAP